MSISAIVETLDRLIEVHGALLELAKEETPVLIENQIDQLNHIVNKENKWIKQIEGLNQQRVQVIGDYLLSRGYKPDPRVTVGDLIKMIYKIEEKKVLMDIHEKLLNKMMELQKVNEINQKLIDQSLSFIDYSINLITDSSDQDAVYGNPNLRSQAPTRNALCDTRA